MTNKMIKGTQYIEIVKRYFSFLEEEFHFEIFNEKIFGSAFFDVEYKDKERVVSISYENIEDYFLVIIFILQNGKKPDYDDKTRTINLHKLNATILTKLDKNQMILNNNYFLKFTAENETERKILKSAKELRLCLKNL